MRSPTCFSLRIARMRFTLLAGLSALPLTSVQAQSLPPLDKAQWIWAEPALEECELRRIVSLDAPPAAAQVLITADNGYELYVNGTLVGSDAGLESEVWQSVERYDISSRLAKGRNVIGIRGMDLGGVRGVVAALRVEGKDGAPLEIVTDALWRTTAEGNGVDYSHPEYVEGPEWKNAVIVGPMGMAPWGKVQWSEATERAAAGRAPGKREIVVPDANFAWPDTVAFVGEDCSVYVPRRGDAWGVAFRIGDWSRAYTEFDLPCPSKIGRRLYKLRPGPEAQPQLLFDAGAGVLGSPSASYDGRSLLVALAKAGDSFFHIHRIPADGGAPQQLTRGPFHDIDPAELPDGRIVFTSTRIGTFEEYHQPPSRALFRMNADGSDIHLITATPIFDNEPKVMASGRVVFIRTDNFFDRGKVETHLHSIRPDGTDGLAEFGANVGADYGVRLRAFGYGSPAPLPGGGLACISTRGNLLGAPGAPEKNLQQLPRGLGDLAPLPDGRLLCTVLRPAGKRTTCDVLGVIDPQDNRVTSLFTLPQGGIHSPVSLAPRPRPPVIPDYVDRRAADRPGATGFLFCQDARFTTKSKAGWDRIRAVRVVSAVPLTVRSSHSHIVHVGHETVELGTVPLAADGSFSVEVPADTPLALQAVDAEGRSELNEMSWLYVRPGERRSCVGCHQPREAVSAIAGLSADALRSAPVKLLGQGDPHRFRGNNPGVTGMMDLQFERFRECASLNRSTLRAEPEASGRQEIRALMEFLRSDSAAQRTSSAQRLALHRSREAAPALAPVLKDNDRETRLAAALALAACGTRESIPSLVAALDDPDRAVVSAAAVALENLTGHAETCATSAEWNRWLAEHPWPAVEAVLVEELKTCPSPRRAVTALAHTGGDAARMALREFVTREAARSPYPVFQNDDRTDNFTFAADSPLNPRTLQEAVRALGHLQDAASVPLLSRLLAANADPRTGNLFLTEACAESLGRLAVPEAERALLDTFAALRDYWHYTGWYSDHPALYACHSSPVHARIIAALDFRGSTGAADIVPQLIRSVPTDPDRGLFLQNDEYEVLTGRLIRRSGRGPAVVESCLALLGDAAAGSDAAIKTALSTTHPAWAGHPGPQNRSAQILSLTCRDAASAPRVRAAFERFRDLPEEPVKRTLGNPDWTPVRHWTLFYLARTLGNLADRDAVPLLTGVLSDELNEARHGRPDPSQPEIHLLQLDYTPCWRAAAAWALGEIGERRAVPALFHAVRNLDNATDVRHAAAVALGKLAAPADFPAIQELAAGYPEVSVRKVLLAACPPTAGPAENGSTRAP